VNGHRGISDAVRRTDRVLLVALVVDTAIAVVDVFTSVVLFNLLVFGPLIAATRARARDTAIVSLYALALGIYEGIPHGFFGTPDHIVRCAAIAATGALGVDFASARAALSRYTGMARRFELRAQRGGITVVDDYAHHPTKVAATLVAARLGSWSRVIAVFQPHRYSRTKALARELGEALTAADVAVVTDVYSAGEDAEPGVDGTLVAAAATAARPDLDLLYVPDRGELAKQVAALVRPGDLVLTLGAGDITNLADELAVLLPAVDREGARGVPPVGREGLG
jgi:hypothetical protein